MTNLENLMVLIPSYEPDGKLVELLEQLEKTSFMGFLVIDDGSGKKYNAVFQACRKIGRVTCIGYETNKGKGYAIKTGFQHIFEHFPSCLGVVTADCDGQHTAKDICRIGSALVHSPEHLILGARNCLEENVPLRSRIGNRFTRWIFKLVSGISVKDTQTGLRAMTKQAMECFVHTEGDRFEYEMNVLAQCRKYKIKIKEIPIDTVYIAGNQSTHFRTVQDSVRISKVFFKFASSSMLAALTDYLLFLLLIAFFHEKLPETNTLGEILKNTHLIIAFFGARIVSSAVNFYINREIVFRIKNKLALQLLKYYGVVAVIAGLTFLLMSVLTTFMPTFLAQPAATLILFSRSYFFQKKIVFRL